MGAARRQGAAGVTLVELLIVVTLMATLAAVLAPILIPSPSRTLRNSASEIATTLRETRRQAQAQQARRRFVVDTAARRYGIEGAASWHQLPDGVEVELTTAESLVRDRQRGGIDFFPDGSSTGGRVALGMEGRALRVDIEWLTGRIRVTEDGP